MNKQTLLQIARPIPGFSGYYISKDGCVYSDRSGEIVRLTTRMSSFGYMSATVTGDDGRRTSLGIHRLLALAYLQRTVQQSEVNHKDGNKFNNDLSNLEWCSRSDNERHKVDHLMTKRTKPVILYNESTGQMILLPSTRSADKYLGLAVNSVSKMLRNGEFMYRNFIVSFV